MKRHADLSPARRIGLFAALCAGLLLAGTAQAAAAPLGVIGYFGNPDAIGLSAGGFFSTAPRGVAVNNSSGEIYVVDSSNHRIQRFEPAENGSSSAFLEAWGADVIPGGASGTGTLSPGSATVTAVATSSKAFAVGRRIEGAGIAPGTTVAAVAATTLTLSQPATGDATGAPTALTSPTGAGNVAVNETQTVTLAAAITGGNFKLAFTGPNPQAVANPQTTANIPFNASPAEVQAALEALTNIGAGNVEVTSSNPGGGPGPGGPYAVEFKGARYADTNVAQMTVPAGTPPLTGGNATNATTVEGGVAYEICAVADECKAGANIALAAPGGSLNGPQGVAVNQVTGDVYVTNQALQRVEQFSATGAFVRAWGRDVIRTGKAGDNPPASAVQMLTVTATGGKYTLEFQGDVSTELAAGPAGATAAEVQAALNALGSIASGVPLGAVTVSGATGGPYTITFGGGLANGPQPEMVAASAAGDPLSGGGASVTTTTPGSTGFEICGVAANCQKGAAGGTAGAFANTMGHLAIVPAGAPNAGNVLVAELGTRRVSEYTSEGAFVRMFGGDVVATGPGDNGTTGFEVCGAAAFDVCKPGIEGSALGLFALGQPSRVAADTSGAIYTVEGSGNFRVQKFLPLGDGLDPTLFNPQIQPPPGESPAGEFSLSGTESADAPTEVVVDHGDDHVYVAKGCGGANCPGAATSEERRVYEFSPEGSLEETHIANYGITTVNGLAVKVGGDLAYLASPSPKAGVYVLAEPVPPTVALEPTTGVTSTSATLHGQVNPNGGGPLHTAYRFEYTTGDFTACATPANPECLAQPVPDLDIGSGEAAVAVEQTVTGLQPNREYKVRLVAVKGGSPTVSTGTAGDFKTAAAPPQVETFAAFWDTSTNELVLRGGVNPNNTGTTYHFEYGTASCDSDPCASVPPAEGGSAGSGGTPVTRVERVGGLAPGATYHFRIVARNGVEAGPGVTEVRGEELTLAIPGVESCANDAFRTGAAAQLPECRAYEWVSDGDSWGLGVQAASPAVGNDGNRAQFQAQAFGAPPSLPEFQTSYTAMRTAGGWVAKGLLPGPEAGGPAFGAADLGASLWLGGTDDETARGEINWSLVRHDGSLFKPAQPFVPLNSVGSSDDGARDLRRDASTPDLSTVVFRLTRLTPKPAGMQYFPDEPLITGTQRSNLYAISGTAGPDPTLSVVNRGDGKLGTVIGGVCGAGPGSVIKGNAEDRNVISEDGSVIYFSARPGAPGQGTCSAIDEGAFGGPKRLFKRENDQHTTLVSEPQCDPDCGGPGGDDEYRGASTDGSVVYFTTPRRLLNADADSSADLYVYDASPPSGQAELALASGASGAQVSGFLDMAADGSRAYFTARGDLTGPNSQGSTPVVGEANLYVYQRDDAHPSGRLAFLGTMPAGENIDGSTGLAEFAYALPRSGGVGDGHLLFFTPVSSLLAEDTDSRRDLYRYDDESGRLDCLSCIGDGAFGVEITRHFGVFGSAEAEGRVASLDGSTSVFTTQEGLVGRDTNGADDVYVWREGALSLVSVGSGEAGATDGAISPDGKNAFFLTRTPLVARDDNNARDLYDARVGGGFAETPIPDPCVNAAGCQGTQAPPPANPNTAGSNSFVGAGNRVAPPGKRCRKGTVRKKGRCVKAKSKKKHQKGKRRAHRAGDNRGGSR